jgi:biotin synthase
MDIERFVFFNERINVLKAARDNGYRVSSGVQFGTGESVKQRLIFAYVLKEFDLDSIALHFPVSKKNIEALHPMELLKIIAIYRFIHPNKEIILSGSHWKNFEIIKPLILLSGANAVMTGNFLTAAKKNALEDIKSLADFKQIH